MIQETKSDQNSNQISRLDFILKSAKGIAFIGTSGLMINAFGNEQQKVEYTSTFHSKEGHYTIPIKCAKDWVVTGTGADNEEERIKPFVERHSKENLWTYNLISINQIDPEVIRRGFGMDNFMRRYSNGAPANLFIYWEKTNASIEKDFDIRKQLVAMDGGKWHPSLDKSVQIDGLKGLQGRFTKPFSDNITQHSTNILLHKDERKYEIRFVYYDAYNDPENTLDNVVMKLKFDVKK